MHYVIFLKYIVIHSGKYFRVANSFFLALCVYMYVTKIIFQDGSFSLRRAWTSSTTRELKSNKPVIPNSK